MGTPGRGRPCGSRRPRSQTSRHHLRRGAGAEPSNLTVPRHAKAPRRAVDNRAPTTALWTASRSRTRSRSATRRPSMASRARARRSPSSGASARTPDRRTGDRWACQARWWRRSVLDRPSAALGWRRGTRRGVYPRARRRGMFPASNHRPGGPHAAAALCHRAQRLRPSARPNQHSSGDLAVVRTRGQARARRRGARPAAGPAVRRGARHGQAAGRTADVPRESDGSTGPQCSRGHPRGGAERRPAKAHRRPAGDHPRRHAAGRHHEAARAPDVSRETSGAQGRWGIDCPASGRRTTSSRPCLARGRARATRRRRRAGAGPPVRHDCARWAAGRGTAGRPAATARTGRRWGGTPSSWRVVAATAPRSSRRHGRTPTGATARRTASPARSRRASAPGHCAPRACRRADARVAVGRAVVLAAIDVSRETSDRPTGRTRATRPNGRAGRSVADGPAAAPRVAVDPWAPSGLS